MTSAGRILILPKGNYNAESTYEMLDLVYHNGASWIARTNVASGIEPSDANKNYWQKMDIYCRTIDGSSNNDITDNEYCWICHGISGCF